MEDNNEMRTGDKIKFCTDLLRKQADLMRQIEIRANIVVGLSGATIAFAVNKTGSAEYGIIGSMLVITATIAIIFALMAIKPPKFLSRHGQRSSIFYHTHIAKLSESAFKKEVASIISDVDAVVEQYAMETYNLVKYSLQYKKMFAHHAVRVLTGGLFLTVIVRFVI